MLALAIFPATPPGSVLAAGDESALEAAQQPPPVVLDFCAGRADPAPVAPDPALVRRRRLPRRMELHPPWTR